MLDDAYVEGIIQIANSKIVTDAAEPNTFTHEKVKPNIARRILLACKLFAERYQEEIDALEE